MFVFFLCIISYSSVKSGPLLCPLQMRDLSHKEVKGGGHTARSGRDKI